MSVAFASSADLKDQEVRFDPLAPGVYAAVAEGDPNVLVVTGDDGVPVVDTTATPVMAKRVIDCIRTVSQAPFRFIVLSHYHAVRVLGASAFEHASVVASRGSYDLILERGEADYKSEYGRFPRLFRGAESIPGLTYPHVVFDDQITLKIGSIDVQVIAAGRGHTKGDTVVWIPQHRILFGGDSIDYRSTPYCGDAYLKDWRATLRRIRDLDPRILVPGRGAALSGKAACDQAFDEMDLYLKDVWEITEAGARLGSLKAAFNHAYPRLKERYGHWFIFEHCIPFSIARAYDEISGIVDPRIWTAERDRELWAEVHG